MSETTTTTKMINFRIDGYENVEPNSLNTESATLLLNFLLQDVQIIDGRTFSDFCCACRDNTLNTELENDLVSGLIENVGIGNYDLYNLSSACQPETLEQNIISNLLDRLHKTVVRNEPVKIYSNTFLKFCRACKPNTLTEDNFAILLEHLDEMCCIDEQIIYYLNKACVKHSLNDTKIIEKLLSHLIINNYTFFGLCSICNYAVLNKNMASQILESNKISFNEIKTDYFPKILSKFTPYARTIVIQKMQKDLTCINKIVLGFGTSGIIAGLSLIVLGLTAQLVTFGIPNPASISLMSLGGTMIVVSGGTTWYNAREISHKKQKVKNDLNHVEEETSEGSNSTETHEVNSNNPTWMQQTSTYAIEESKQFNTAKSTKKIEQNEQEVDDH